MTAKEILKTWFSTGKRPTGAQFAEWLDSYLHKSELTSAIAGKLDKQTEQNTVYAVNTSGNQTNIPIGQLQIIGSSIARRTVAGTLLVGDAINGSDAVNLQTMKGYAVKLGPGNPDPLEIANANTRLVLAYDYGAFLEYFSAQIGLDADAHPFFYDGQYNHDIHYNDMYSSAIFRGDVTLNGALIANGGLDVSNMHVSGTLSVDAGLIVSDIDASGKWINFLGEARFQDAAVFESDAYFYYAPYFYDGIDNRPILYVGISDYVYFNGRVDFYSAVQFTDGAEVWGDFKFNDYVTFGYPTKFNDLATFNSNAEFYGATSFYLDTYFSDYVTFEYPVTFGNVTTFGDSVIINAQLHVGSNSFFNNPAFFQTDTYFNDDAILASGVKILGTRSLDGAQEVLIELGEYGSYEHTEVGSEARPLCLKHNSVGSDGTAVGKNILVNYKNGSGAQQVDAVAYLSDVRFLSEFPLNQEVNIRGNIYAKRVTFSQATPVVTISPVVLVAGAIALLKVEGTMQDNPFSGYYSVSPDSAIMKFTAGTGITLSLNWSSGSVISYDILIYYTK
jgi:acetyltransferase-like isoleucine patch superfamily enzyme